MGLIMRRLGDEYSERALETQTGYELHKVWKGVINADREKIIKGIYETQWRILTGEWRILNLGKQLGKLK